MVHDRPLPKTPLQRDQGLEVPLVLWGQVEECLHRRPLQRQGEVDDRLPGSPAAQLRECNPFLCRNAAELPSPAAVWPPSKFRWQSGSSGGVLRDI